MAGATDEFSFQYQVASVTNQIGNKLQGDVSADWLSCSIFKVPNHLRQISEQAYEPQVVSIGPYHNGKGQLKKMEGYKMFYLKMLLERKPEIRLEEYVMFMKTRENKARKFYSEPWDHISGEEFVEMMLLDGCFIIELIRKSAMKKLRHKNDHLLTLPLILRRAMLDLLLVENQLPYFILSELFVMTVKQNDEAKDFMGAAIKFFSKIVPIPLGRPENQDIKHLLGLLHDSCQQWQNLSSAGGCQAPSPVCQEVRISCLPEKVIWSLCPKAKLNRCSSEVGRSSPPEPSEEAGSVQPSMAAPLARFSPPKSLEEVKFPPSDSDNLLFRVAVAPLTSSLHVKSSKEFRFPPPTAMTIPSSSLSNSAEEEAIVPSARIITQGGPSVSFSRLNSKMNEEKNGNSNKNEEKNGKWQFIRSATELREAGINFKKNFEGTLFDIKFEKGVMSIPTLSINDDTESILRNLVAYEQCFKGASSKCFTDYITFMDCLINTGKDVELLCLHGVINNWLGDYEAVAAIFNKLRDSVLISEEDFSYAETFNEVNKHCDRKWNQWKANLWHNYFNTPWAGISFFAAVFLLLFAALQSVYSVLSYHVK